MNEKKPKPPKPTLRGEKWELWNGEIVTVIGCYGITPPPMRIRIIEVITQRGTLSSVFESDFKKPVTGDKHG